MKINLKKFGAVLTQVAAIVASPVVGDLLSAKAAAIVFAAASLVKAIVGNDPPKAG